MSFTELTNQTQSSSSDTYISNFGLVILKAVAGTAFKSWKRNEYLVTSWWTLFFEALSSTNEYVMFFNTDLLDDNVPVTILFGHYTMYIIISFRRINANNVNIIRIFFATSISYSSRVLVVCRLSGIGVCFLSRSSVKHNFFA